MDAFCNPDIEHIVCQWSTQVGKTEMLYNCLGYVIDQDPSPTLLVMPNDALGLFVSKNRIQPMVEACERLREKKPDDEDDYTNLEMKFQGMIFSIAGANSASSLSTRPVRFLFRDEVNKYPPFVGKEADPLSLSKERTKNFWNRKIFDVSTPTTDSGNITRELETCDVIYDYHVPCPHCGTFQVLTFPQIKWPHLSDNEKMTPEKVRTLAWYECESCKGKIDDVHKIQMLRDGEWRPRQTGIKHPRKVGFHLPAWYSPWITWGQCAAEFLASKDYPEKLMNFKNSWEAEPWIEKYEPKTVAEILENAIELPALTSPKETIALTCGIDPGQGGYWFAVVGWKWDMSPHLVHYGFLVGWDAVRQLCWENFYKIDGTESQVQIWRAGLDTGGSKYESENVTMTEAAYDWLRQYGGGKVFATKGMSRPVGNRVKHSIIDKMPGTKGRIIPGGISLWSIDTGSFKDSIQYRLQVKAGDPGRFTFHKDTKRDYVDHLLAEEKRKDRRGNAEWVVIRSLNHLLDCTVIAFALADPECWGGIKVLQMNRLSGASRRVISKGVR